MVPLSWERYFLRVICVLDGFELLDVVYELLNESVEFLQRAESVNGFLHLAPCECIDERRVLWNLDVVHVARQQVLEVLRVDNLVLDHQLHDHVETEQQLILVEEGAAHFDLEQLQKGHVDVVDSLHVVILTRLSFGASIFELHFVPD